MDWYLERTSVLLQNCDLPPPLKLFSPFDNDVKIPITPNKTTRWNVESEPNPPTSENSRLLRALQLSQSRAREAEKKASALRSDGDRMAALLFDEALRLSAHRQWMRILETELALLRNKKEKLDGGNGGDDSVPTLTWCLTLALCLGIGFALGRCLF